MRREYAKIAGWTGLILMLVAGVAYGVRGIADWTLWAPLGTGAALAAWWLTEFRQEAKAVVLERRTRQGANSAVLTLAVLAILVLLQAFINANDKSWDVSGDKQNTLSGELVNAVKNLDQKVEIKAFFGPEGREAYEELLRRARLENPSKLSYEFLNPNKEGLLAKELGVRTFGTSVVQSGDKRESINSTKEEDLLNAIVKVSSGTKKSVYLLTGHQEASPQDQQQFGLSALKLALDNATFMTKELNLAATGAKVEVPSDAAALVVAGPRLDILAPELDAFTRFLGRGGRIFVALDPRQQTPGLKNWLGKAGVNLGDDIVVELSQYNQLMGLGPESALVQSFDRGHSATKDLASQGGMAVFTLARTASLGKLPEGATGTVLAKSLPSAYAWRGTGNRPPAKPGPGDIKGPLDLMVAIESPLKAFGGDAASEAKARLVVIGNSGALGNAWMANPSTANSALFLNSVRWLADEEKRISLPAKPKENNPIVLDAARASLIRWSMFFLLLGTLGTGILVARARKRAAL